MKTWFLLPKDIEYDTVTRIELLKMVGLPEKDFTSVSEYDIGVPLKF